MARCYPWRDVIHGEMLLALFMMICYPWREVVHGDMLSMARCCPWRDVIHGAMLSMARCYLWRDVIHGAMLSMARCYLWRDVIHGAMLSMARYLWRDVIHGAMLSMARCYLWRDVIITIHDEMVSNISESFVTPSTILLSCTTFINVFRCQCCRRWCSRGHQLSAEWDLAIHCLTIRHRRTRLKMYIILVIWHFGR